MRYGLVENGIITLGPRALPTAWRNISGLDKLNSEELKNLGWLPWILVETSAGPGEVRDGQSVEIFEDRIVETQLVRALTPEEIQSLAAQTAQINKETRAIQYREESDPLFFKWQAGEATKEEWIAKREEIRNRYP